MAALAPHLPVEQRGEALAAARAITCEDWRAGVLAALAPHLPVEQLGEALAASTEGWFALVGLSALSRTEEWPGIWESVRHHVLIGTRWEVLQRVAHLGPLLELLGSAHAVHEVTRSIRDVGRWWP